MKNIYSALYDKCPETIASVSQSLSRSLFLSHAIGQPLIRKAHPSSRVTDFPISNRLDRPVAMVDHGATRYSQRTNLSRKL